MKISLLLTTECFILFISIIPSTKSSSKAHYQKLPTEETASTTSSTFSNDLLTGNGKNGDRSSAGQPKVRLSPDSHESATNVPRIKPFEVTSRSGTRSPSRSDENSAGSKKSIGKPNNDENERKQTSSNGSKAAGSNNSATRSGGSSGSVWRSVGSDTKGSNTSLGSSRKTVINDPNIRSQETISQSSRQVVKSPSISGQSKSDSETSTLQSVEEESASESESSDGSEKPLLNSSSVSRSKRSQKSTTTTKPRQTKTNGSSHSAIDSHHASTADDVSMVTRHVTENDKKKASDSVDTTATKKVDEKSKTLDSAKKTSKSNKPGETKTTADSKTSDDADSTADSKTTSSTTSSTAKSTATRSSSGAKPMTSKEVKENEKLLKKFLKNLDYDSEDASTASPRHDLRGDPLKTISRSSLLLLYAIICCLLLIMFCQLLRRDRKYK